MAGTSASPISGAPTLDQYLNVHLIRPGLADLSGKVFPGSIRDQVLRAILVTDGLWRQKLVSKDQRVLVIGAGAAGIASALRLSLYGANVWLVEQRSDVLTTLSGNTARIVSPAIYDWPSAHSWCATYGTSPLTYHETTPSKVAITWKKELASAISARPECLHLVKNVHAHLDDESRRKGAPWKVIFEARNGRPLNPHLVTEPFEFVFDCKGIGAQNEQTIPWQTTGRFEDFPMFGFWGPDCFPGENQPADLPPLIAPVKDGLSARVVIVGAGDGGLQDFLRFTTQGMPVRHIMEAISRALSPHRYAYRSLYRLMNSEHSSSRHFTGWHESSDAKLFASINSDFNEEINELYLQNAERRELLDGVLRKLVKFDDILVVQGSPGLGRCYPINRFLAILFDLYLRHNNHPGALKFGLTAKHVECLPDHDRSSKDASVHFGGRHLLTVADHSGATQEVRCGAVIPRLGPATLGDKAIRQALPHWVNGWEPLPTPSIAKRPARGVDLDSERGCRRALWRYLAGSAVIKDSKGRVLALNRRFAHLLDKAPEEILGHSALSYVGGALGESIEADDQTVRISRMSRFGPSRVGLKPHFTFRFFYPFYFADPGSAAIGFTFDGQDRILNSVAANDLEEPSPEWLERFFEWMPCSVAVTNKEHRYLYGNQAFRRIFTPPGLATLPACELLNSKWNEILNRLGLPPEKGVTEHTHNEKKRRMIENGVSSNWTSDAPFDRARRMVVAFPILDSHARVQALGSVGFRYGELEGEQPSGSREYKIEN